MLSVRLVRIGSLSQGRSGVKAASRSQEVRRWLSRSGSAEWSYAELARARFEMEDAELAESCVSQGARDTLRQFGGALSQRVTGSKVYSRGMRRSDVVYFASGKETTL